LCSEEKESPALRAVLAARCKQILRSRLLCRTESAAHNWPLRYKNERESPKSASMQPHPFMMSTRPECSVSLKVLHSTVAGAALRPRQHLGRPYVLTPPRPRPPHPVSATCRDTLRAAAAAVQAAAVLRCYVRTDAPAAEPSGPYGCFCRRAIAYIRRGRSPLPEDQGGQGAVAVGADGSCWRGAAYCAASGRATWFSGAAMVLPSSMPAARTIISSLPDMQTCTCLVFQNCYYRANLRNK
jgi:hypothetical protein